MQGVAGPAAIRLSSLRTGGLSGGLWVTVLLELYAWTSDHALLSGTIVVAVVCAVMLPLKSPPRPRD